MQQLKASTLLAGLACVVSACSTLGEDDPTLAAAAIDATRLYLDCPATGQSIPLNVGDYTATDLAAFGMPNDNVSALKVTEGYKVEIFLGTDFKGRSLSFTDDDPCLVDNTFNDLLSPVRVTRMGSNPSDPTPDPNVLAGERLINQNFQNPALGTYTTGEVRRDFPGYLYGGENAGGTEIREEGGNRFMRSCYPEGKVGPENAGNLWAVNISDAGNEINLSCRVRFVGNFDFVRSGKLAGICGGTCACGGNAQNPNQEGWNFRDVWTRNGGGEAYLYYPGQSGTYGDAIAWSSGFTRGQWTTLKTRIRLNTPGQNDGVVQNSRDGQLVLDRQDARIRQNASTGFDRFLLISFFGGATSDFAASKDEYIDFDDFVFQVTQRSVTGLPTQGRHKVVLKESVM